MVLFERERATKTGGRKKKNSTSTFSSLWISFSFFSLKKKKLQQGDLAKLGLAVLSMAYNVIILVQHYWTFAGRGAPESESTTTSPLLSNGGGGVGVEDGDGDGERV